MRAPSSVLLSLLILPLMAGMLAACGDTPADDPGPLEQGHEAATAAGAPFTAGEFKKFLVDLPAIPGLAGRDADAEAGDLGEAVRDAITSRGWDQDRFLYIYSHAVTIMNLDQMRHMADGLRDRIGNLPEDKRKAMEQATAAQLDARLDTVRAEVDKQVPASEQAVIRDNMDALMNAMGMR